MWISDENNIKYLCIWKLSEEDKIIWNVILPKKLKVNTGSYKTVVS